MKTRPKKLLGKAMRTLFAIAGFLHFSTVANAQQPCQMVSSMAINTGYDPATGAVLGNGAADPNWKISSLSSYCQTRTTSIPQYPAVVPNANLWTALSSPNSNWLSFLPAGFYHTTGSETVGSMYMGLRRTFKTCTNDNITFTIKIAADNYCSGIYVDGVQMPLSANFSQTPSMVTTNYTAFTTVTPFTVALAAGTHTIDVVVHNYPQATDNPHGVNIEGQVSSATGTNSIVGPQSAAQCSCSSDISCSDICYWKVQGNNILNGNNIFGTLTRDNVRIQTASADRGVMTADGLFGWNNMYPKAYLDVNCTGNNPDDGSGGSDVRFENLEPGTGFILVIDDGGFVYNSRITPGDLKGMKAANDQLQHDVKVLQAKLDALSAGTPASKSDLANGNHLLQNTPNPFSGETRIDYYVAHMEQSAYIMIYDLNGKELKRLPITVAGKGSVTVSGESLQSGMYIYALIVDGQEADSKKMTLIK